MELLPFANIGFKSNELLQLKHILHMDLSDVKLNELLKSNNLDAQRTTCLMRKILQVIELYFSNQAESMKSSLHCLSTGCDRLGSAVEGY
ncbi:hypothetical protein QL285_096951 [Trifolium repens]|nr:hypothetical protein QL285_096951 [Trifolium repens]